MKTPFNPWPYGILAFFILLFCGMAAVVVIAATHQETLVTDNYYEQELKFQDQLDGAARARNCGAHVQLESAAGKLLVAVPAPQLAQQFSGTIQFYRPSAPELDRVVPLAPGADGSQLVDISGLAGGLWHVRVKWSAAGQGYFLEEKLTL
jgi:hypothetical protein